MRLNDLLRDHTHDIRDAIEQLTRRKKELLNQRLAAEEHHKRTRGDIKSHRDTENSQRTIVAGIQGQIGELKARLEEIERQRSEILETIFAEEAQLHESNTDLTKEQRNTHEAEAKSKVALRETERLDRELHQLSDEETRLAGNLRHRAVEAFDKHLTELGDRLPKAMLSHAARQERDAAQLALRRTRNQNAEIGLLCDELDQIKSFLTQATVPSVRNLLDNRRHHIESLLESQFPGSTTPAPAPGTASPVEELFFYTNGNDHTCIVLPFRSEEWQAAEKGELTKTNLPLRIVWTLIRAIGLPPNDATISLTDGRWQIQTSLTGVDSGVLESTIPVDGIAGLSFALSHLPREIEEALNDENPNR